jgi:hypothetical protein
MTEQIGNKNMSQIASQMLEKIRDEQDKPKDAIKLLKADHDEAQDLYKKFSDAETSTEKELIAAQLCLALSIHMRIEEDIFYPAVARALQGSDKSKDKDELIVPEAKLEHESLKKLIGEVELSCENADFDAHLQVMCEYTNHHLKEEENKMFPRAKDCGVDMDALGRKIMALKVELLERAADSSNDEIMPSTLFGGPSTSPGLTVSDRL